MSGLAHDADDAASDISSATLQCFHLLRQCLEIGPLMEREWAENKLADFTLWASGIGAAADASDKISLDARLAGKPGLIQIFTHLLQMLARFLVECQTLSLSGPDERGRHQDRSPCRSAHSNSGLHQSRESQRQGNRSRSISPWSDQSSVTSEPDVHVESGDNGLAEARRGVDSTLDQLNNLSIAVRRTGNQLRLRKADARFDRSEHANLEAFLRVWVLAHTTMDALNVMQDADRLTPIQKRLIEVNLRRRNRFLYAQQHSKKMAYKIVAREPQKTMELAPASTSSALPKYEDENPKLPSWTPKRAEAQEKHLAETWVILADNSTATRFGATTDIFKERLLPQNSQITTTAARVSYPDPPKLDPDTQFFKCPCCCQTPSRTLVRGNLWRKHHVEDICPYTCIHPKCPQPEATWPTRQAWIDHMRMEEHLSERSWNCLICADGIAYANPSELARHTSENHAEVTADQMATLLDASLVPISNNEFPCPLCRPNGAGSSGEAPADLNHIAEHIHSFALLSLPWAPDVPAVEKKTWQESCQKVVQWLGLNEQATTVFPENPVHQQTTMDETSLYFEKERYFAENARTHSESDGLTSESDRNLGSASPLTMSDNSEERVRRRSDDSPTSPSDAVRVERPSPPPPLRELIVSDNISEIEETGMSEEEKSLLSSTEDATIAQRNASRADAEPSQSLGGIDTSPASSAAMLSQQTPVDIEIPSWLKKSGEQISLVFEELESRERSRLSDALEANSLCHLDQSEARRGRDRYSNVQPWDAYRVKLREPVGGSDYINASYIRLKRSGRDPTVEYIATQGPKEGQYLPFWQMVMQETVGDFGVIIMLTKLYEGGQQKCAQYFPPDMDNPVMVVRDTEIDTLRDPALEDAVAESGDEAVTGWTAEAPITVTLRFPAFESLRGFEIRDLQVERHGRCITVQHYLLESWPDFGRPEDKVLDALRYSMRQSRKMAGGSPRIVHGSAGVGRTGTWIALDYLWHELEAGRLFVPKNISSTRNSTVRDEREVDCIFDTVNRLRKQRMRMVSNEVQLRFIYEALRDAFVKKSAGFRETDPSRIQRSVAQEARDFSEREASAVGPGTRGQLQITSAEPGRPRLERAGDTDRGKHIVIVHDPHPGRHRHTEYEPHRVPPDPDKMLVIEDEHDRDRQRDKRRRGRLERRDAEDGLTLTDVQLRRQIAYRDREREVLENELYELRRARREAEKRVILAEDQLRREIADLERERRMTEREERGYKPDQLHEVLRPESRLQVEVVPTTVGRSLRRARSTDATKSPSRKGRDILKDARSQLDRPRVLDQELEQTLNDFQRKR